MRLLLGHTSNILGYPSKYSNYTSKTKLGRFPHSSRPPTPQPITFLLFISQKILLNINDVEFDFRMGCILILFPFLSIIKVQFTHFGFLNFQFVYFQIKRYRLTLIQNYHFYHWNFSKTRLTYKILDERALIHTGWDWKIHNFIFSHFWELKNSSHAQTFKYMSRALFSS